MDRSYVGGEHPATTTDQSLPALLVKLVSAVSGAEMGSISSTWPERMSLHTDERAALIEAIQLRNGTGPCVEAMRTRRAVLADLMEIRLCWPIFARCAREAHVFSFLVVPLIDGPRLQGTLSLYGPRSHAIVDHDVPVAQRAVPAISSALSQQARVNPKFPFGFSWSL